MMGLMHNKLSTLGHRLRPDHGDSPIVTLCIVGEQASGEVLRSDCHKNMLWHPLGKWP